MSDGPVIPPGYENVAPYAAPIGILDASEDELRQLRPTEHELKHKQTVARGEPALLERGFVYQAFWQDAADGMAIHARRQVRALAAAGVPVRLEPIESTRFQRTEDYEPEVLAEVGYLRNVSLSAPLVAIRQAVLHSSTGLRNLIVPKGGRMAGFEAERRVYAHTIVYTSWERRKAPAELVDVLKRVGQLWVPCDSNRRAFVDSGMHPDHVHVVPCPYDPATHGASQIPSPRGSSSVPDGRRFYCIGKWEPRKGHHALIGAFLQAFSPKDRVSLLIKTGTWGYWQHYPTPEQSLQQWAHDSVVASKWTPEQINRRVRILTKRLSDAEMVDLHRKNNIYVSLSHGEAWDLPAFDAVAAGNSLVHVGFGGSEMYAAHAAHVQEIPYLKYSSIEHPEYGWPDAEWAEYSGMTVINALQCAEPPPSRVHPRGLYPSFGYHVVGAQMRALLERLLDAPVPPQGFG